MSLKKGVSQGILWVGISEVLAQILNFTTKVILAKILLPDAFGLVAIGLFIINTFALFQDLGIGASLVQKKNDIARATDAAFVMISIMGLLLFVLSYRSASFFALFFDQSIVRSIVRVLAFVFLIYPFSIVPSSLLSRELLFKKKAIPQIISIFTNSLVSITMALKGFGVWSLVWGHLSATVVYSVFTMVFCRWKFTWEFNWQEAKQLFDFGHHVFASSLISFLLVQADKALIGKILGATFLGYYSLAYVISHLSALQVTHVISKVTFPAFSKLQEDKLRLKEAFLKTLQFLLLIIAPITFGILTLGREFVILVLGHKWGPMILPMQILCLHGLFRSIHINSSYLLTGVGLPNLNKNILLGELVLLAVIIYPLTASFKLVGTAVAVTIARVLANQLAFNKAKSFLGIRAKEIGRKVYVPLVGSVLMGGVIIVIKMFVSIENITMLIMGICLSMLTYVLMVSLMNKEIFRELKEIFVLSLDRT